jgi:hypothetical protein
MRIRLGIGFRGGCCVGAALLVALAPRLAWAVLGEPESSIAGDAQFLEGSIKEAAERANYRVHEIQLPSGTLLREFATPGGTVFAVAWSGPMIPNLRQALGHYFDTYVAGAQAHPGGRHHFEMKQNDLVVQSGGHMRRFSGRAYLPQAVPAGVSVDELH